ncbi:MAG TPA: S8 family serine peptidase, partial [Crocinitomicaceae bacterium]|nr:S8 family serine peptidase [Crocinitomicaceae bacterium]
ERYDYMALNDVPAKISLNSSNVYVAGASQKNAVEWELATLSYTMSSGTLVNNVRSTGSAVQGVDEIKDITVDNAGNIYLTGSVNNISSGYDIAVYKLDDQLNMIWEQHFDGYGQKDVGNGIKVDNSGNVYVAGYVSTPNEGRNYALLKYNSSGVLQWNKEYNGTANADDEAIQLVLGGMSYVLVTGSAKNTSVSAYHTLVYDPNGELITQAIYENGNLETVPTGIAIDLDGEVIVVGQSKLSGGTYETKAVKYKAYFKPIGVVYIDDEPAYNDREVIIRFDRSAIDYSVINRKGFIAGQLGDFLNAGAISSLNATFKTDVSGLPTFKIFRRMTTADSLSVTRLGDTIKVDDFWATLSIILPIGYPVEDVVDAFNMVDKGLVHYAEKNKMVVVQNGIIPNDPRFSIYIPPYYSSNYQTSLIGSAIGIDLVSVEQNSEPYLVPNKGGWLYETGKSTIKVGVFDTGITWQHEDLGDGTWLGSRVKGGWDYGKGVHPSTQTNSDPVNSSLYSGHGTAVAGIIGAIRNNGKGIAGIAGGNYEDDSIQGVSLYSLRMTPSVMEINDTLFTITTTSEAILEGAVNNPQTGFGFGLDIQNYSWVVANNHLEVDTILHTLRNAVNCAFKNNVIQVASSGNIGFPHQAKADSAFYPASFNNEWILKVGAHEVGSINNIFYKKRTDFSVFGPNVDVLAPGIVSDVHTLSNGNDFTSYIPFDGTSASAPHVSGVAALMLSLHNPEYEPLYPNKLGMEDVEFLIKHNADPIKRDDFEHNVILSSPNKYSGYGALNANKALSKTSLPYKVYHFNQKMNLNNATIVATNQTIDFPEGINGIPPNSQIGNTTICKLTENFNHYIPTENIFINGWIRNASSDLYDSTNTIYNSHWSGTKLNNVSLNNATVSGYFYAVEIISPDSTFTIIIPEPNSDSTYNVAYSVYVKDTSYHSDLGLEDVDLINQDIIVYPNPTNQYVNIFMNNQQYENIYIYDITGKYVNMVRANNSHVQLDISTYSNGIYLLVFENKNMKITKKLIKK